MLLIIQWQELMYALQESELAVLISKSTILCIFFLFYSLFPIISYLNNLKWKVTS